MKPLIQVIFSLLFLSSKPLGASYVAILKNLAECFDESEIEMVRQFESAVRSLSQQIPANFYCDETVLLYSRHYVKLKRAAESLCSILREKCAGKMSRLEIKYTDSKLKVEATLLQGFIDNNTTGNSIDLMSEALSSKRHSYPELMKILREEFGSMLDFIVFSALNNIQGLETLRRATFCISKLIYQLSREIYPKKSMLDYSLIRSSVENNFESRGLYEWDKALSSTFKKLSPDEPPSGRAMETMATASINILQSQGNKSNNRDYIRFLPLSLAWNFKNKGRGESYSCLALLNFRRMSSLMDRALKTCRKKDFLLQRFRYSLDILFTFWKSYFTFPTATYFNIVRREMTSKNSIHRLTSARIDYFYPYDEITAQKLDFMKLISVPEFFKEILGGKEIFEVVTLIVARDAIDFFHRQMFPCAITRNDDSDTFSTLDLIEEIIPSERREKFMIFKFWYVFRVCSFESDTLPNFLINSSSGDVNGFSSLISFGENVILSMEFCLKHNQKCIRKVTKIHWSCKHLEMGIKVFWWAAKELGVSSNPKVGAVVVILVNLFNELLTASKGIVFADKDTSQSYE